MSESKSNHPLVHLFNTFFGKHWPVWVGGIVLGMLNTILFAIKSPWGASGGVANVGDNIYSIFGLFGNKEVVPINENNYGMLVILIVLGSFAGALFSKEFALRI
ncbi:YeeE/YedE family protein, partial [bacterium]|nr:YeeE/YedE family protein [bacterium]